MRALMGIIKDRHGTYYARQKVPPDLREAVARVLDNGKATQSWLKQSLSTKKLSEANVRAKPVLMGFDQTLERAKALVASRPLRRHLSNTEITRMADFIYQRMLAADDVFVREAPAIVAEERRLEGEYLTGNSADEWVEPIPDYGLSGGQLFDFSENVPGVVAEAKAALARGDVRHVEHKIADALEAFQINLDRQSEDYVKLGHALLRAYVRGLEAMMARRNGEPIETPALTLPQVLGSGTGGTLSEALEGWQKERAPSEGVLNEYMRAVRLFTEFHGDIPVAKITKGQARTFREALQDMPRHRSATLRDATLPELAEWGREHPHAQKISNKTANKLLGGVQTIARWADRNGIVPEGIQWSDPFANMRLREDEPDRAPFTVSELNKLFAASVFTKGERPQPGKGEASFWLPLLALFTGARRSELASLRAKDVEQLEGVWCFLFVKDKAAGKALKTPSSARVIPIHPELLRLGLLRYIEAVSHKSGQDGWLFPEIAPDKRGALKAWTKWFIRYLRAQSIPESAKVFHSFRHLFKDALRHARVPEDLNDALTGHANASVGRGYGAKTIVNRYGVDLLKQTIYQVQYRGLDLIKVRAPVYGRSNGDKRNIAEQKLP